MSNANEHLKLTSMILKGEMKKAEVIKEIERISALYGEDYFNSYEVKPQPKPWTEKELKELEILSASGAGSKEFYLYMAEVSEEVYSKKGKKKKWLQGILIAILVVFVLAVIICIFHNDLREL